MNRWIMPVLSRYRVIPMEMRAEFEVLLCGTWPEVARRMIAGE